LDVGLQRFDLLADGRGGDIQRIGGFRKTQVRGHRLEHPQGSQRQSVVCGWHLKFSLTVCQALNLFGSGAGANLCNVASIFNGVHIMNDLFFVARLVQGLLAVTIVSAIVMAIQFSLVSI
jgi:hypothetical protein